MKQELQIGDLAEMFGLSVQTLRLYDEKGLIVPDYRNEVTNWRGYSFNQTYKLAMIRFLRRLGCSLGEIKDFYQNHNFEDTKLRMQQQSQTLRKKCEELLRLDAVIQMKLRFLEDELSHLWLDEVRITEERVRHYIYLGNETTMYKADIMYFYPTIVFYTEDNKLFGAYLLDYDQENKNTTDYDESDVKEIPAGKYLTTYFKGPFEEIRGVFDKIRKESKYNLEETGICTNIIDQFVENDRENYVTELQIRIMETSV